MTRGHGVRRWLHGVMVAVDQLCNTIIAGNPDETISSRVGRAAIAGSPCARELEWMIDGLFRLLGEAPGHCRRNIEWDEI